MKVGTVYDLTSLSGLTMPCSCLYLNILSKVEQKLLGKLSEVQVQSGFASVFRMVIDNFLLLQEYGS